MVGVWRTDVGFGGGVGVEVLIFGVFGGELGGLAFCVSWWIVIHLGVLS